MIIDQSSSSSQLIKIKQQEDHDSNNKFYSRLLSKESSIANPSLRVYYGGVSVAVPFVWESEPGTPKSSCPESTLPPLTPPPSYYNSSKSFHQTPGTGSMKKYNSRSNLLHFLFPRIASLKKPNSVSSNYLSPSPSSSSSFSSSSFPPWSNGSGSGTTPRRCKKGSRFSSSGSSFDYGAYDEEPTVGSPTSTLCFSIIGRRKL